MNRQIKIDGQATDWYETAIFVLKEKVDQKQIPKNIVSYAEDILERHMKVQGQPREKSQQNNSYKWIDVCFWMSIGLVGVTCLAYFLL